MAQKMYGLISKAITGIAKTKRLAKKKRIKKIMKGRRR
tara:strand:+ start:87 stop:200 length:114 start_codon:yes stop_codon:yes gene_type:complete